MHRATHRRLSLLPSLLLPAALLLACDRADELDTAQPSEERSAAAAPTPDDEDPPREHAHHRGKGKKIDKLCESLACTDAQRERIEALAERLWAERPEPTGDRDAANRTLARAFGGDSFAAADLQAYRAAAGPDTDEMDALVAEAVVELHGILDAEQRATLADKVERRGLPFVGGRGPKHGRGGDEHGARLAERLCTQVSCSEAQAAEVAKLAAGLPDPGQVPQADRDALAQAMRGPSLSDDAVHAYLDAAAKARAEDHAVLEATVVELHGLLTPEQRATLAERLAEDGPRGLVGKGHHGKGKGKKHGPGEKKHRRGGPGPRGEASELG